MMLSSMRKSCTVSLAALTAAAVVSLLGCSKGPVCGELGRCGGNLVGTWAQRPLSEDGSGKYCQESLHSPPLEEYRLGQPTPVARQPVPESTNLDWCYNLVLTPGEMDPIKKHLYWWEDFSYNGGLVTYQEDGRYTIDFSRDGRVSRWYSRTCLTQYGHDADCKAFETKLAHANEGAREYDFFECSADTKRGGCNCSWHMAEANAQAGLYSVNGGVITHFSNSPTSHYSQASMCVRGDTIEISGLNNSYIWDRPGLRSIELVRVNCEDGRQGPGEAGVDCGLRCPNACPQ